MTKEEIQIFKFGGASVKDADGVRNVGNIIAKNKGKKLVVIVSAMGKSTNAFEGVVEAYVQKSGEAESRLEKVKQDHYQICKELFGEQHAVFTELNDVFVEADWVLEEEPHEDYDFVYDQIVSIGELVSSKILAAYMADLKLPVAWLDARGLIRTDNRFREARVDWDYTMPAIEKQVGGLLNQGVIPVSQGFIGSTSENYTTTLGREGSDFTAAIFSFCLNASSMTIWK
ncbi:MAG: aspartate kinase, partial [Saprospiraceae bacterium]|nr:aspartate kinase [Saprospiraceae bacterium]